MADISTVWDAQNLRADWVFQAPGLQSGTELQTAVLISLFTDRQADPDDVIPDGSGDPRGWPGDMDEDVKIGSRLWLLDRAKQTEETRQRATGYIVEALQWMIDDGVAAKIDVACFWNGPGFLAARVTLFRSDGKTLIAMQFDNLWKATTAH